jgi:glucose/arabinose dehydrogenase
VCLLLQPGSIFGALDSNDDGVAETTVELLSGMNAPNGIAWHKGSLYVAEISRVTRFDDADAHVLGNKVRTAALASDESEQ